MNFITTKKMAQATGISNHQLKKVLTEKNLYDRESHRPTQLAIENGLAEERKVGGGFTGKIIYSTLWNYKALGFIFPKKSKHEIEICCRAPCDAFIRICNAFCDYGEMLEIKDKSIKLGISKEAIEAVYQCYYSDADFLRGTLLFHRFMHPTEAESVKAITLQLSNELYEAARNIDGERARQNLWMIELVLQWLCDEAC